MELNHYPSCTTTTLPTVAGLVKGRLLQLYSPYYCMCTDESVAKGITSMDRDVSDPWDGNLRRSMFRCSWSVFWFVLDPRSQDASGIKRHQLQCSHERLRKGWSMGIKPPPFRWCCWLLPTSVILLIPEVQHWRISHLYLQVCGVLTIPCGYPNLLELLLPNHQCLSPWPQGLVKPHQESTDPNHL